MAAFVDGRYGYELGNSYISQGPSTPSPGVGRFGSSPQIPKVDLGPLVGAVRGFRTRERVPGSGGLGGVEMIIDEQDVAAPSLVTTTAITTRRSAKAKGKEKERIVVVVDNIGSGNSRPRSPRHVRRNQHDGAMDTDPDSPQSANIGIRVERPSPSPITPAVDYRGEGGEGARSHWQEEEEHIPPKMRKRWIAREVEAMRETGRRRGPSSVTTAAGTTTGRLKGRSSTPTSTTTTDTPAHAMMVDEDDNRTESEDGA